MSTESKTTNAADRGRSLIVSLLLLGLAAAFGAFVLHYWLAPARIDLTEDDIYSLTPGSAALVERMSDEGIKPVDVTLSPVWPLMSSTASTVLS